jgi:hypothetical protein
MKIKIITIFLILIITSCATVKDKMPKRKSCTGEKNTVSDLICKK